MLDYESAKIFLLSSESRNRILMRSAFPIDRPTEKPSRNRISSRHVGIIAAGSARKRENTREEFSNIYLSVHSSRICIRTAEFHGAGSIAIRFRVGEGDQDRDYHRPLPFLRERNPADPFEAICCRAAAAREDPRGILHGLQDDRQTASHWCVHDGGRAAVPQL